MSLVSLKFAFPMFGIPLIIFLLAFIQTTKRISSFRYIMMVLAILLAIILFFYYRDKFRVSKQLKKVDNLAEYANGGVVDCSWVLEDRILCCLGLEIHEVKPSEIKEVNFNLNNKGKGILHLNTVNGNVDMSTLSQEEAQRFCGYLKRKNQNIVLNQIQPKGNGTLQELGAGNKV